MLHHKYTKGKKNPLVFLHGYCEDQTMWEGYTRSFVGHSILAVDLPGFGKSPSREKISIIDMAQEVQQVIQHHALENVIVIGHSMGGYVAVALSRLLGSKLKGLCMFHSHPFEDNAALKEKRTKGNAFIKANGSAKFAESLLPSLFAPAVRKNHSAQIQKMITAVSQLSTASLVNGMSAMRDRPDMQEWVKELNCPYHCILGTEDIPTPLSLCLPQVSLANITKVTILPEVGHMGMFTATEVTQLALHDFIKFCLQKMEY